MDEKTDVVDEVLKPAEKPAISLPAMKGGFGGAASYVPSAEEVEEQKAIHAEVEARYGGELRQAGS